MKLSQVVLFLALLSFNLNIDASQEKKMDPNKFDYISYGLLNKNELSVKLHLWKGTKAPVLSSKPKPPQELQPKIEPPPQKKDKLNNAKVISVSLEFTNISSREIHLESRFWFTRLQVFANDNRAEYIGPMVSIAPPNKKDFATLRPGDKFATEPVVLNEYYRLADDFNGTLKVTLQLSPQVPEAMATLSVD